MNSATRKNAPAPWPLESDSASRANPVSVATRIEVDAPPDQVWGALVFYEQLVERSPLLLRILLPTPLRAVGSKSNVGDVVECVYTTGTLKKRMVRVDNGRQLKFEVFEQNLRMGGIHLMGGSYTLQALPGDRTGVQVETYYKCDRRPRRLWMPLEALVCRAFHRHILNALRRSATGGGRPNAGASA